MSERSDSRAISFVLLVAFWPFLLAGCRGVESRYVTLEVPPERLRQIEMLDLRAMSAPEGEDGEERPGAGGEAAGENPPAVVEMTLEECRAAALENNLDLKVSLINPAIAAEGVNQEQAAFEALFFAGADFSKTDAPTASTLSSAKAEGFSADLGVRFPLRTGGTLTFDLPATRSKTNNLFSTLNPSYTSDLSTSISHPLLRGAGIRANTHALRIARYGRQISEAATKLEVIRVLAAADRVYWGLYAARAQLEVRKNEYDLAVAQLERARRFVEAGTAAEVEVIRAETGVAERLEAIILAENTLRQRERELKRAVNSSGLGLDTSTALVPTTEPDPVHYNLDPARLVAASIENRMEMLELELRIAQDASSVDFNRSQRLPAMALDYTYTANGLGGSFDDAFDQLSDKDFEDHAVGVRLEVPLGNAAARSRLRQAIFQRVQRLATRAQRALQIEQEVRDAVDNIEAGWQRVLANRQRTILAARNLDAEVRQFEQGMRTSTEVLEAQTRLADAQSAEVAALADYQIAQVDLAFATGTLLGAARVDWEPTLPGSDR